MTARIVINAPRSSALLVWFAGWLMVISGAGCGRPPTGTEAVGGTLPDHEDGVQAWPVTIRKPEHPPAISMGAFDGQGRPLTIACATCHATKPPNAEARIGTPLTQFHQQMVGRHGDLSCTSCHNPVEGYASLRLADGKSVPYREVMMLCAQCHGPQYRDYQHGAHGGMTGYWDLSKGGRARNNCVDCHDAHTPKYPTVAPARGPNDRFQTGDRHE